MLGKTHKPSYSECCIPPSELLYSALFLNNFNSCGLESLLEGQGNTTEALPLQMKNSLDLVMPNAVHASPSAAKCNFWECPLVCLRSSIIPALRTLANRFCLQEGSPIGLYSISRVAVNSIALRTPTSTGGYVQHSPVTMIWWCKITTLCRTNPSNMGLYFRKLTFLAVTGLGHSHIEL